MDSLEQLVADIMADEQNASYTEQGIKPLFTVPKTARINIVGQAPGIRAQESGLYWNDPSGDNLRKWLGVDRETFYNSGLFAVVPMDYYFPGKGKSGDLAPRKGFADKWHKRTLALAPNIELHILVGSYAQRYYLKQKSSAKLTDTVKHYKDYLPEFFPLVHPSPRNNIWLRKNPWFEEEVIPDLQKRVKAILEK
ncbi:Uracil-DNA glycosylase [Streptococcus infantarius subsp. infantarius]|uniref:uracil-DNA glycosylase family protein n=1 Tax=uncultured Streptococcus sp. TaxID=83427 RepID=UPI00208E40EE|nr:uracil-DNA glycosylase family protein [uncultured Streptococcus sp.]MCO4531000.1 Uracil-DNA glycosylase [Streptococcus infantarius subsp. infantarius]MCO4534550.1 Uracil-DNA glycosylase [Streptococcus infantarius subsp. infantarius]MCO4536409.1 Uracil-DNA glycosylase [Streptococcus infantarius subsp. infantarius]MCO4549481.1 Uracil-DNA glycosylase [Streptococcus infantarius subsp. infantarius]MCO4630835.1 Uracil-DNA glycosylase [Streptococcus infantarius subsp. infantarius]